MLRFVSLGLNFLILRNTPFLDVSHHASFPSLTFRFEVVLWDDPGSLHFIYQIKFLSEGHETPSR